MNSLARKLKIALLLLAFISSAFEPALAATPTPMPTLPPLEWAMAYDEANPGTLFDDQLYAQSAILINQEDGRVLYEKNADARMNPASTTKVMTLMLALEYGESRMQEVVTVPAEAASIPADSSKVPVQVGEQMIFADLLYGLILRSGNDAANAIAVIIGGSVENFVRMMNERAQELGCIGTRFANVHGYTEDGHYTTARDMAIIARAAMQMSSFRKIVVTTLYLMPETNMRKEYGIGNTNLFISYGSEYWYRYATGIKTGNTSAAGQCFVGSATKNGIDLISVVMKSTVDFPQAKWVDSKKLMEYGFAQYRDYTFSDFYEMTKLVVPISGAVSTDENGGILELKALLNRTGSYTQTVYVPELSQALARFQDHLTVEYTHSLQAPIEVGTIIGKLTFAPEQGELITAVLVADRAVEAAPAPPAIVGGLDLLENVPQAVRYLILFLLGLAGLFLVVLLFARSAAKRRARRRRAARRRSVSGRYERY